MANYYLEVARALQGRLHGLTATGDSSSDLRKILEIAAKEFGIREYRYVYHSKRRKASLREESGSERDHVAEEPLCRHSCCEHEEVMNADRWGTLPHDLLQLVLARLPVKEILLLRRLSKGWKESMVTGGSGFFEVCNEVHPKMFAFIRKLGNHQGPANLFLVRVFDTKWNTWHAFQISLGKPEAGWRHLKPRWRGMISKEGGSDGGLVLFYLEAHTPRKRGAFRSFFYTVVNPLTQRCFDLPPILDVRDVHLQQIVLERETNRYKVLIVVDRGDAATDDIQVFDSGTGEWSQPNEATDIMFGNQSAYDFAKGKMIEQYDDHESPFCEEGVVSYTFLKNRLFMLLEDIDIPGDDVTNYQPLTMLYYIKEYAVEYYPQHPPTWLELEIHRCVPFEHAPKKNDYKVMLHSSNGFLMVFAAINESDPFGNNKGWIYDLSTRTWRNLPKLPGPPLRIFSDIPCEIRWNAHPLTHKADTCIISDWNAEVDEDFEFY